MKILSIERNEKGQFIRTWSKHRIKTNCLKCNYEFETVESRIKGGRAKYCSIDCYNKVKKKRRQSINTEFKKGGISPNKGKKLPWCTKEKHWNWQGGISEYKITLSKEWKEWREKVFKRDKYTCKDCGVKNGNGKTIYLHPHHIKPKSKYPNLIFNVDNGMTLCIPCHKRTDSYGRPAK